MKKGWEECKIPERSIVNVDCEKSIPRRDAVKFVSSMGWILHAETFQHCTDTWLGIW